LNYTLLQIYEVFKSIVKPLNRSN